MNSRSSLAGILPARIVVAGCARDCGPYLPAVLANVERAMSLFTESAIVLVENDSSDDTVALLEDFAGRHDRVHVEHMPGLVDSHVPRTARLAAARNVYLDIIAASTLRDFDYLMVVDMDDANTEPWDLTALAKAVSFLGTDPAHAGVFANQPGCYCDMWALRHPLLCPGDIWQEVMEYALSHNVSDQDAFEATFMKRLFFIPSDRPPLEVESAFGGLGIYRMVMALPHRYVGMQERQILVDRTAVTFDCEICEHVPFHEAIRSQGGRLFILPWLVNWSERPDGFDFKPSAYRDHCKPRHSGPVET